MSMTEAFVSDIEIKILSGEWQEGMIVPSLRELSAIYGVSRSVVNAGIVELQNKGFLKTYPRKYSVVADWKKCGNLSAIECIIEHETYDQLFIDNILDARMTIECTAARDAAKKRDDKDLAEISEILLREKLAVTIDQRTAADIDFHHAIAIASHNMVYPLLLKSFDVLVKKLVTCFYQNNSDREFVTQQHHIIYKAICDNKPTVAEDTMYILLRHGEDIVKKTY